MTYNLSPFAEFSGIFSCVLFFKKLPSTKNNKALNQALYVKILKIAGKLSIFTFARQKQKERDR